MATVKKTKKVLGAKKEVTKKDAEKVEPLMKYWDARLEAERWVDNWGILAFGVFLGFLLGLIAGL